MITNSEVQFKCYCLCRGGEDIERKVIFSDN